MTYGRGYVKRCIEVYGLIHLVVVQPHVSEYCQNRLTTPYVISRMVNVQVFLKRFVLRLVQSLDQSRVSRFLLSNRKF